MKLHFGVPLLALIAANLCIPAQASESTKTHEDKSLYVSKLENLNLISYNDIAPFSKHVLQRYSKLHVAVASPSGIPEYVTGDIGTISNYSPVSGKGEILAGAAKAFELMGIGELEFSLCGVDTEADGSGHYRFKMSYMGTPIDGTMVIVHVSNTGNVYCVNGDIPDVREIRGASVNRRLTTKDTKRILHEVLSSTNVQDQLETRVPVLQRSSRDRKTRSAWKMFGKLNGDSCTVYIDDETGLVTDVTSEASHVFGVTYYNGSTSSPSYFETTDSRGVTPTTVKTWSYASTEATTDVNIANYAISTTQWYLTNTVGTGFNETFYVSVKTQSKYTDYTTAGGNTPSIRLESNDAKYTTLSDNRLLLFFGPGDGVSRNSLASDYEVVAHEFGHMYFQRHMQGQPAGEARSIMESVSDCLSKIAFNTSGITDWRFGKTAFKANPLYPTQTAIRYLNDPTFDQHSRDYYPNRDLTNPDDIASYNNAGILNLVFKLAVTGGVHPNPAGKPAITVPAIPYNVITKAWVRAAYYSLTPQSTFAQFRQAVVGRCRIENGGTPAMAQFLDLAFAALAVPSMQNNPYPVNMSCKAWGGTGVDNLVVGMSLGGNGSKPFLIRAVGPTLVNYNMPTGYMPDPVLTLKNPTTQQVIASNDDWSSNVSKATSELYGAFALAQYSKDSVVFPTLAGEQLITAEINPKAGTANGVVLAEIYTDPEVNTAPALLNLSARQYLPGNQTATVGFVIGGEVEKKYLIRAVGPTLANFGVPSPVSNPTIKLYASGVLIATNDNWGTNWNKPELITSSTTCGAFALPDGSPDAAMLISLPPGTYTVEANSVGSSSGTILFELYTVY